MRSAFCSWWLVTCLAAVAMAAPVAKDKAKEQDKAAPVLEPLSVDTPAPGAPVIVSCRITDKSEVFAPVVLWRAQGSTEAYAQATLQMGGPGVYRASLTVPADVAGVEYYFEAYDVHGNGPGRAGEADNPLRAAVVAPAIETPAPADSAPVVNAKSKNPPVPAAALAPGMVPVGRVVAVGAFAAGAAALVLAGVYGLMAYSDHAVFKSSYDPAVHPAAAASVKTEALAADVSLGVGLALGVAGAASWILSPGAP